MKQILISLSIIGVTASLVIGGTIANFRDEERAIGNIFQAGIINLELNDGYPGPWGDGARYTWKTAPNWSPGDTISNTLHLRNDGNINAARLTMVTEVDVDNEIVGDGFTDATRMDKRIIVSGMTFGGVNLLAKTDDVFTNTGIKTADVNNNQILTLDELAGITLNLSGINVGVTKALFIRFTFDENAGPGYMGDEVEAEFTFGLHQE